MKTKPASLLFNIVAGSLCFAGLSFAAPNYVAHEWGTFTSVQGADGVQMAWNPLSVSDLPGFVYNWAKSGSESQRVTRTLLGGKLTSMTLQRMETPVIYFYSDAELTVDTLVKFPQGTMTEWYPKAILPGDKGELSSAPNALRWDKIRIVPGPAGSGSVISPLSSGTPPSDSSGSHYYAARDTDADLIQVNGETEKFLFYRGVGNFRAPLTVTQAGDDVESVTLRNTGSEELRHLFLYQVNGDGGRFVYVPALAPGGSREVKLDASASFEPLSSVRSSLAEKLEKSLEREGLYKREARAMVKTWDDSWLGEKGVRVLYTLPGAWTDRTLPLTLTPAPAQVVRVMVGRAELITPRMEWDLMRKIVQYGGGSDAEKAKSVAETRALGLGRFLEPAIQRLTTRLPSQTLSRHSAGLMGAVLKEETAGKRLAAK